MVVAAWLIKEHIQYVKCILLCISHKLIGSLSDMVAANEFPHFMVANNAFFYWSNDKYMHAPNTVMSVMG